MSETQENKCPDCGVIGGGHLSSCGRGTPQELDDALGTSDDDQNVAAPADDTEGKEDDVREDDYKTSEGSEDLKTDPAEVVGSTSDERIINNVMRHNYRILTEDEKKQMLAVKDSGLAFVEILHSIGNTKLRSGVSESWQSSRELSLAQTQIEDAVMWAVKHITK